MGPRPGPARAWKVPGNRTVCWSSYLRSAPNQHSFRARLQDTKDKMPPVQVKDITFKCYSWGCKSSEGRFSICEILGGHRKWPGLYFQFLVSILSICATLGNVFNLSRPVSSSWKQKHSLSWFLRFLLLCHARISLPEGVLLCVLDDVQYQDYLFQKAVVLLFAVPRGNPDILWRYGGVRVAVGDWRVSLCRRAPVIGIRPCLFGGGHPTQLCSQTGYLQGSTHKTTDPFDSSMSFQSWETALDAL